MFLLPLLLPGLALADLMHTALKTTSVLVIPRASSSLLLTHPHLSWVTLLSLAAAPQYQSMSWALTTTSRVTV